MENQNIEDLPVEELEKLQQQEFASDEGGAQAETEQVVTTEETPAPEEKEETKEAPDPQQLATELRQKNAALAETRSDFKRYKEEMEGRFTALQTQLAALGKPQEQEEGPASWETEPLKAGQQDRAKLQSLEEKVASYEKQQQETGEALEKHRQLVSQLQASENQFRQTTPDYDAAAKYLGGAIEREALDVGYAPEQAQAVAQQRSRELARGLIERGLDPAATIYKLAKDRGYKRQETPAEQRLAAMKNGQEASPQPPRGGSGAMTGFNMDAFLAADPGTEEYKRLQAELKKASLA